MQYNDMCKQFWITINKLDKELTSLTNQIQELNKTKTMLMDSFNFIIDAKLLGINYNAEIDSMSSELFNQELAKAEQLCNH